MNHRFTSRSAPKVVIRGIYGGVPTQIFDRGKTLEDFGVNAIWIGAGGVTSELITSLESKSKGLKVECRKVEKMGEFYRKIRD